MNCYPGQRAEGESADALMEDLSDNFGYPIQDNDTLRPHSTQATITWLDLNYQLEEGVCLPRSTIYEHYQDFCERDSIQPVNAASFGKIIRQQFPSLTTRRLGTRGQSKYHYYGLGIKPSSLYYTTDYVERLNQGNPKKSQDSRKATYHEKPSAVLPPFPEVKSMTLSNKIPMDKLKTFMVMYRAHCQRILDSVVRANFTEVESFLLHFWQGMPTHMLPVLASDVVVDLVAHCDTLLYKVISNVLITSPLQNLPDSLAGEIRKFSDFLQQWMEVALKGLPESLQEAKCKVAEGFVNGLRRQTSLTKLAQVARSELRNSNCLEHLKHDWECLDMTVVYAQTLYAIEPFKVPPRYHQLLPLFRKQFDELLNDQTDLENFMFWAEDMIQTTVLKAHIEDHYPLKEACQAFILTWKFFTSKMLQEFTMENAPSFGFLILLHMLMDDYITHILESKLEKEDEKMYYSRIQEMKKDNQSLHIAVSNPPPISELPLHPVTVVGKLSPSLSLLSSPSHETPLLPSPISEPELLSLPPLSLPRPTVSTSSTCITSSIETTCRSFQKSTNVLPSSALQLDVLGHVGLTNNRAPSLCRLHTEGIIKGAATSDFSRSLSNTNLSQSYMRHSPQISLTGHPQHQSNRDLTLAYPQPPTCTHLQSYYATTTSQQQQLLPPPRNSIVTPVISPSRQSVSNYGSIPIMSDTNIPQIPVMASSTHHLVNLPSINQSFSFTRTGIPQQQQLGGIRTPKGVAMGMVPDLTHGSAGATYISRTNPAAANTMVTPSIPSLPSFTALNVPFVSSSATSIPSSSALSNSSNLPSLLSGIYPYTPFVGIPTVPTQMNTPFAQTGLQMPAQPTAMAGYPYIPGVSPSLYSTQVSSNSFTR